MNRQVRAWLIILLVLGAMDTRVCRADFMDAYCQHQGTMKFLVHLDADPTAQALGNPEQLSFGYVKRQTTSGNRC